MNHLVIQTKIIGRRGPVLAPIEIAMAGESATVRELIASVVRQQVASFRDRQESRRLIRLLTERQMNEQLEAGRVAFGGESLDQPVDVDAAIEAACVAFADEFFYVFLDEVQVTELDAPVALGATTEALFLRLVPLVGG